jgi:hypothetical protein
LAVAAAVRWAAVGGLLQFSRSDAFRISLLLLVSTRLGAVVLVADLDRTYSHEDRCRQCRAGAHGDLHRAWLSGGQKIPPRSAAKSHDIFICPAIDKASKVEFSTHAIAGMPQRHCAPEKSFPKIQSGGIRAMRENQRINNGLNLLGGRWWYGQVRPLEQY